VTWLTRQKASYGSLARFKDVSRLHAVGDYTVIGAGGDMSDFQYLQTVLDDLMSVTYPYLLSQ
jgi:20S proteasome subunit beta 7